jgi:dihydrolipoamide dehydrogenase
MVVGDLATQVDVLVLGAGPGGYSAAVRAAQLGQEVILVDSGSLGGGWRQNYIPAKALANAAGYLKQFSQLAQLGITTTAPEFDWAQMQAWKNSQVEQAIGEIKHQLDQHQVELVIGQGWFLGENEARIDAEYGAKRYLFDHAVIAVGCTPTPWPGLLFDGARILTPAQALALTQLPESLSIIGADYIAAGLAAIFANLGVAVGLLLPAGQRILSEFDPAAGQVVQTRLQELGVQITDLTDLEDLSGLIIVSAGLTAHTEDLALDQAKVNVDTNGFIEVNDRQRTSNSTIYAVGDVTGAPPLAHVAIKQGQVAADNIAGRVAQFAPQAIPRVAWTDPPVAAAGMTAAEAEAGGYQIKSFRLNLQSSVGFIELVAEQDSEVLVGVTIVGPEAEALIGEVALALEMGATLTDLAETLHPSLGAGENLMKAAEAALK